MTLATAVLKIRRAGPLVATLGAVLVALVLMQTLSRRMDYHSVIHALRGTPVAALLMSLLATLLSYVALLGRDAAILRFIDARVVPAALVLGAACGSAVANIAGFGPLSGGAVRYRVYGAAGLTGAQVARLMAWMTVSFGLGLVVFSAAGAALAAPDIAAMVNIDTMTLRIAGIATLCLAVVALAVHGGGGGGAARIGRLRIERPTSSFALGQLALTVVDLLGAGAALWVLLPSGRAAFAPFMAVFAVATALGALSHAPGGLGVFEAVVIYALGKTIPPSQAMGALIAYRAVYFFLPLLLSSGLLAAFELRGLPAPTWTPTMLRVRRGAGQLVPTMLGLVTFALGVMLLLSGATPDFSHRLAVLEMTLPLWVVESSHFLESSLGVLLLFIARGLAARLDGAWWMALGIAAVSLVLSLAKGLAFVEAALLLCLIVLLILTRRLFDRPAWLLREPFTPGWFMALAAVIAVTLGVLLFAFRDVAYRHELWWQFAFDAKAPRALRATVAAVMLAGGIAARQLLRLDSGRARPSTDADLQGATGILRRQQRSETMLALMRDKSFLFNESRSAFLMYSKRGRNWVALYDPVGNPAEQHELIDRFVVMAHRHGGRAAFYQVRPETLSLYLDAGLHLMKIGEEAWIDLTAFGLEGSHRSHLRYALKRGERDGLTFALLRPDETAAAMPILRRISDAWLHSHKASERGFSIAGFEPGYVAAQLVAIASLNGEAVAFATCMVTDLGDEATIGLMRYVPDASGYAMEYLFTHLALELKRTGFRRLSLGVAPLSGLARTPLSSTWHRVGGLLWRHGTALYDFQGLRRFKNKFAPQWEPRYLAANGVVGPFVALADVVAMTSARTTARMRMLRQPI